MDYCINLENLDFSKKYWLNDAKNLVTALSKVYHDITLTKLSQQFEDPTCFEKELLNSKDKTLVRKITLSGANKTLVFARTIIPQSTYNFFMTELTELGTKPIGDNLLFDKERFYRDDFIVRELPKAIFEKEAAIKHNIFTDNNFENIYSRSSIFKFKLDLNIKILITEYFIIIPEVKKC